MTTQSIMKLPTRNRVFLERLQKLLYEYSVDIAAEEDDGVINMEVYFKIDGDTIDLGNYIDGKSKHELK